MIDFERKEHYGLSDLLRIVALLRSEDGCPWDRVQTHASLRRSLLEEAYEAAEAIDREDPALLKEELGDLLLQVVFHADIERRAGNFTMDDVADGEVRKMLFRHPHVFGGQETVQDADTVLEGWEAIKRREKGQQTTAQALDAVVCKNDCYAEWMNDIWLSRLPLLVLVCISGKFICLFHHREVGRWMVFPNGIYQLLI